MTEIFWLKTWFAVSMIGLVWFSIGEWKEHHYDLTVRVTSTLISAAAGFLTFAFGSAFVFLIGYGVIWFFTT